MIDRTLIALLAGILVTTGLQTQVLAQETGGVRIHGSVKNTTSVKGASNIARGSGATAKTSIGSIGAGVTVDGNLTMDVSVDGVTNVADGVNETAVTSIGSVHKGAKAKGEIVVNTGNVTNVSNGPGETSCIIIGSKGHIPECDQ
ncbi:MAG: hypothetical protein AAFO01_22960 [Pseudomonadota bacterium]